jgi:hypothetical protein
VDVRPGDNLMIHAAIALAKPGDVLVIDGKGDQTAALMGTIMMTACKQLGLAGVVIDGAVRDSLEIDEMDYPVFSFGTNPNGPTKNVPGRIGHPVSSAACGALRRPRGGRCRRRGRDRARARRRPAAAGAQEGGRRDRAHRRSRRATPALRGWTPPCARPAC